MNTKTFFADKAEGTELKIDQRGRKSPSIPARRCEAGGDLGPWVGKDREGPDPGEISSTPGNDCLIKSHGYGSPGN